MRRLQILMDPELDDALKRVARKRRLSKSALIREIVREKVRPLPPIQEDPLWDLVGTASFEPVEDIDEFLYGPYTPEARAADEELRRRKRSAK